MRALQELQVVCDAPHEVHAREEDADRAPLAAVGVVMLAALWCAHTPRTHHSE